jgi:hypothetical protein
MSDRRHRRAIKLTVLRLSTCAKCGAPFWSSCMRPKKFCAHTCERAANVARFRAKQPKSRAHACLRCGTKFKTRDPNAWYCKRACREGVREDSDAEYGLNTRTAAERKRWASNLAKRTGGTMDRKRTRKERGLGK